MMFKCLFVFLFLYYIFSISYIYVLYVNFVNLVPPIPSSPKHVLKPDVTLPLLTLYDLAKILVYGVSFIKLLYEMFGSTCGLVRCISLSNKCALMRNQYVNCFPKFTITIYINLSVLIIDSPESLLVFLNLMFDSKVSYPFNRIHISPTSVNKICQCVVVPLLGYFLISQVPIDVLLLFSTELLHELFYLSGSTPPWIIFLKIILSNDIERNPGDFINGFFNFCNWNLNSLAKDNFSRVQLLEADNSGFNYDLISLCETSLNDSVELPNNLIENYTFLPSNNPNNTRHGGVGLFYKNSLPLIVRDDLAFDETIVVELKFGSKKIFFTVIYRSPAFKDGSLEFEHFLLNFNNLFTKIKDENPYVMFFTGDLNGHSQLWWPDGGTTPEGNKIEEMTSNLGLSQLISEPTNFEPNKIHLVLT